MPTFAAALQSARKPPKHVTLPAASFHTDWWGDRPEQDACLGLCFVSDDDVQVARGIAVQHAQEIVAREGKLLDAKAFDEAYNDSLITTLVARATHDPNDASKPYFAIPEMTIRRALIPEAIRRLWDELTLLHVGSGVAMPTAGDDEVRLLGSILVRGVALASAPPAVALEVRKMATYLLEQLRALDAGPDATADDDDDLPVYVVNGTA